MANRKILQERKLRRANRTRAKIFGTSEKPRLSVFRSNKFTYAQLIDDENGNTLACSSSREIDSSKKGTKVDGARLLGEDIAEKAEKLGIKSAVFDRGRYKYHGRVSAVAEGARNKGLKI